MIQKRKERGQALQQSSLAKFFGMPLGHTDPLSSMSIRRPAHLHRWVFMVRSRPCSQFDSSDPKAPDVCLEIVTSDLKDIGER